MRHRIGLGLKFFSFNHLLPVSYGPSDMSNQKNSLKTLLIEVQKLTEIFHSSARKPQNWLFSSVTPHNARNSLP